MRHNRTTTKKKTGESSLRLGKTCCLAVSRSSRIQQKHESGYKSIQIPTSLTAAQANCGEILQFNSSQEGGERQGESERRREEEEEEI